MSKRPLRKPSRLPRGLVLLHEDRDILVVDKPAGLLTIGTETERERTAYWVLTDYVRRGDPRSRRRVFIVHRLDRETSGVLVFAKSEEAKRRLQEQWPQTEKKYLVVVHGRCQKASDVIASYLTENQAHIVYSTPDPKNGKLARTAYRVLQKTRTRSLLEVELLPGRKNQVRVHLAEIGHPVVGDKKYGRPRSPYRRLALHARSLSFEHPTSGKRLTFLAKVPGLFDKLMGPIVDEENGGISPDA